MPSLEDMDGSTGPERGFFNREAALGIVGSYLEQHERRSLLLVSGPPGIGKSSLVRQVIRRTDSRGDALDVVRLDFDRREGAPDRRNAFEGLLSLRRRFGGLGWSFPEFDLAAAIAAQKFGHRQEQVRQLTKGGGGLAGKVLTVVLEASGLGVLSTALQAVWEQYGEEINLKLQFWRRDDFDLEGLIAAEEAEILAEMSRCLARDLNTNLVDQGEKRRLLLFADHLEAFWIDGAGFDANAAVQRDRWFRRFLVPVDLDRVAVVLSATQRPRWEADAECRIGRDRVKEITLSGLPPESLPAGSVSSSTLRLLQEADDTVHPLAYWGYRDRSDQSVGPSTALGAGPAQRILQFLGQEERRAVLALGQAQSFDRNLFLDLMDRLSLRSGLALYEGLCRRSFVTSTDSGRHRVSRILTVAGRELLGQAEFERVNQALSDYYASLGSDRWMVHLARIDAERRGVLEDWFDEVDQHAVAHVLNDRRRELCNLGLDMATGDDDLAIILQQARLDHAEGARTAALRRLREVTTDHQTSVDVHGGQGRHQEWMTHAHLLSGFYARSIDEPDSVVRRHLGMAKRWASEPSGVRAACVRHLRARASFGLAKLLPAEQSQRLIRESIADYLAALARPNFVSQVESDLGSAYLALAHVCDGHEETVSALMEAERWCRAALDRDGNPNAHHNLGDIHMVRARAAIEDEQARTAVNEAHRHYRYMGRHAVASIMRLASVFEFELARWPQERDGTIRSYHDAMLEMWNSTGHRHGLIGRARVAAQVLASDVGTHEIVADGRAAAASYLSVADSSDPHTELCRQLVSAAANGGEA